MSYSQRRPRYNQARASMSDDDNHMRQSSRPSSPLSPPRPHFLATGKDRGSWSSQDTSLDPASESDREMQSAPEAGLASPVAGRPPRSQHHYRRSSGARYAPVSVEGESPNITTFPQHQHSGSLRSANNAIPNPFVDSPTSGEGAPLYPPGAGHMDVASPKSPSRQAPSAYPFPYPGSNSGSDLPAGASRPSRRSSVDSLSKRGLDSTSNSSHGGPGLRSFTLGAGAGAGAAAAAAGPYGTPRGDRLSGDASSFDADFDRDLGRPYAPFMAGGGGGGVYGHSPHGSTSGFENGRMSAAGSFRSPFLSPHSRPTSWAPPQHAYMGSYPALPGSPAVGSMTNLALAKPKAPMSSTLLDEKLTKEEKPWLKKKDGMQKASWWATLLCFILGIIIAAFIIYRGWIAAGEMMIPSSKLCSVFTDDFSSLDVDSGGTWSRVVELGGFDKGEFHITTASDNNLYLKNNQLYIMPTLTSASIGSDSVFDGYTYDLGDDCTTDNTTACSVTSDSSSDTVINPVETAMITTQGSFSIAYGKVEVVAKLPLGDWLRPSISLFPVNNTYGEGVLSGVMDLMMARGNGPSYAGQGSNFVRSTLSYGPLASLVAFTYGWQDKKQTSFDKGFHTYTMEWTSDFLKMYVDSRLTATLALKITGSGGKSFWERGDFPSTAINGTSGIDVVVDNVWEDGTAAAPFDQQFYLALNLAVGGTDGWFEDTVGDKPWYDSSTTAMTEFAEAQDTWSATWSDDDDTLAFRVSSVKMWSLC